VLYIARFQDVRVSDPFFGFVPRRLVGVLGVSTVTATLLLTGWGRVDWADPGSRSVLWPSRSPRWPSAPPWVTSFRELSPHEATQWDFVLSALATPKTMVKMHPGA